MNTSITASKQVNMLLYQNIDWEREGVLKKCVISFNSVRNDEGFEGQMREGTETTCNFNFHTHFQFIVDFE